MKVLFLDFDGVLNSEASFRMEKRRKTLDTANTLSVVACSNLQYILEQDSSIRIVISSTWRLMHTMVELQNILNAYGVEAARIIGKTPAVMSRDRAHEINLWLGDNPNVTKFVVLDDDSDVKALNVIPNSLVIQTDFEDGLLLSQAKQAAKFFRREKDERQSRSEQ